MRVLELSFVSSILSVPKIGSLEVKKTPFDDTERNEVKPSSSVVQTK